MNQENQTNIFALEDGKEVRKSIPISEAIKIYEKDVSEIYRPIFFQTLKRCKVWQGCVGEAIGKFYQIKSVVDFGCGLGYYLRGFKNAGADNVLGIESAYKNAEQFIPPDIIDKINSQNVMEKIDCGKFDLSMSIEVAEHILPEKSENLVDNIVNASRKYVIFTAAKPGQGGEGHINERERDFWIDLFRKRGFEISVRDIWKIRTLMNGINCEGSKGSYFDLIRRQIMFFIRT